MKVNKLLTLKSPKYFHCQGLTLTILTVSLEFVSHWAVYGLPNSLNA